MWFSHLSPLCEPSQLCNSGNSTAPPHLYRVQHQPAPPANRQLYTVQYRHISCTQYVTATSAVRNRAPPRQLNPIRHRDVSWTQYGTATSAVPNTAPRTSAVPNNHRQVSCTQYITATSAVPNTSPPHQLHPIHHRHISCTQYITAHISCTQYITAMSANMQSNNNKRIRFFDKTIWLIIFLFLNFKMLNKYIGSFSTIFSPFVLDQFPTSHFPNEDNLRNRLDVSLFS